MPPKKIPAVTKEEKEKKAKPTKKSQQEYLSRSQKIERISKWGNTVPREVKIAVAAKFHSNDADGSSVGEIKNGVVVTITDYDDDVIDEAYGILLSAVNLD